MRIKRKLRPRLDDRSYDNRNLCDSEPDNDRDELTVKNNGPSAGRKHQSDATSRISSLLMGDSAAPIASDNGEKLTEARGSLLQFGHTENQTPLKSTLPKTESASKNGRFGLCQSHGNPSRTSTEDGHSFKLVIDRE